MSRDRMSRDGVTQDITYRMRGRVPGTRTGAHPSRAVGSLGTFRDQVPFMAHPDARRIDMRATLRDPFENTFVRRFQQRASIDVYAVVDLSGSLRYQGHASKKDLILSLCTALARSAVRIGDRFGLMGCDALVRPDCFMPASKRRGAATMVADLLAPLSYDGTSAAGLIEAGERLAGTRKLVFLISDYLLPVSILSKVFASLAQHDVVPVIIGDSSEAAELPDWGLLELADLETGNRTIVFMRPRLKARWLKQESDRRTALWALARRVGRTPVILADRFDAEQISRQLLEA